MTSTVCLFKLLQEIGGHCEMPRPTKEQVVLDVAADPADEINTSSGKALGVSSGVSRDIEALSSTAGFPPPADAADEQKQIIQTHNHDEDEKDINLKSLKESLLVQETTQRPLGNLAARAGAGAGTAEQTRDETHGNGAKEKSTVAKAEKSFVSCKSPAREPTSGGRQMTAKEKPRETKSVEKTNIPVVFQRDTVVIEERAKALEFNAAAVAELSQLPAPVSVELSKRSVEGSACSRKDDEEEVGGAAGGNAFIGVESITSKTEDKVVITTKTSDKCRYASASLNFLSYLLLFLSSFHPRHCVIDDIVRGVCGGFISTG